MEACYSFNPKKFEIWQKILSKIKFKQQKNSSWLQRIIKLRKVSDAAYNINVF